MVIFKTKNMRMCVRYEIVKEPDINEDVRKRKLFDDI